MNKLRTTQLLLLSLTLSLSFSLVHLNKVDSEITNFPLIMWTHGSTRETKEFEQPFTKAQVLEAINTEADAQDSNLVLLIVKEKLSTPRLVQQASDLDYIKSQILTHSKVYINVKDTIKGSDLQQDLTDSALYYSVENTAEVEILKAKIASDVQIKLASDTTKRVYSIISVHETVNVKGLDYIVKSLEEDLSESSVSTKSIVVAILGTGSNPDHYDTELLNFIQAGTRMLQQITPFSNNQSLLNYTNGTLPCNYYSRTFCINSYITPNGLNGIIIGLVFVFFFIFGVLQLFYVQTPSVFASQMMDFGKIEKQ